MSDVKLIKKIESLELDLLRVKIKNTQLIEVNTKVRGLLALVENCSGNTQKSIGKKLGVSAGRCGQIIQKHIRTLDAEILRGKYDK